LKVFISAGEVSGDVVGALLAAEIWKRTPSARVFGVGGSRMEAAGVTIDFGTNHLGTVGITEPVFAIPAFLRALRRIRARVRRDPPDIAVLIGNDIFNVLLGRWLRARSVPTVSYFPPQVWIWRSLARFFAGSYDLILTSFPEEQRIYERTGKPTRFVGHYLCETLRPPGPGERDSARARLGLDAKATVVGLMPGSRLHEVRRLAPVLLDAAVRLLRRNDSVAFVLPVAEPLYFDSISKLIQERGLAGRVLLTGNDPEALRACDLVLLASGTASLEAALLGVPMVIIYRVSAFTIFVVRTAIRLGLMDSETMGLPNLVLGRMVVPELRQESLSVDAVLAQARRVLEAPRVAAEIRLGLAEVRSLLRREDVIGSVAESVLARASRPTALAPVARPVARADAGEFPRAAKGGG
jgi:lipid-A-disaccharide synthase